MTAVPNALPLLLVADPDPSMALTFRQLLRARGVDAELLAATTMEETIHQLTQYRPHAVILNLHMHDNAGLKALDVVRRIDANCPVILISHDYDGQTAIEAMKRGAYDYLTTPLTACKVLPLVSAAFQVSRSLRSADPAAQEPSREDVQGAIVGRSPAIQEIYKTIGRVAPHDLTVLILGESGTGKELVARALHQHGLRAHAPFLAMNCAAIPETLLESELFGHEKGAFTGAERQRIGKFEQCNGGTIFLDEIGDMTALTQAKILRLLQDQQFERVGGNATIRTDVRVIAATHRPLEELVAAGHFRCDLYYRLSVFSIALPPLRGRVEDLPLLVDHFLAKYSRELGKEVRSVSPEALSILAAHSWPGNVRELQSTIKQALVRAHGPVLLPDFLPPTLSQGEATGQQGDAAAYPALDRFIQERLDAGATNLYSEVHAQSDRQLLEAVLQHTRGNQLRAARILGVTRAKLRARLRALDMTAVRRPRPTAGQAVSA